MATLVGHITDLATRVAVEIKALALAIPAKATGANLRALTDDAKFLTSKAVADAVAMVSLTDAATIAVDLATGVNFSVELGGNRTLGAPTNAKPGASGVIIVRQPASGGPRTLAFSAGWKFFGDAPSLSTTANAVDRVDYLVLQTSPLTVLASLAKKAVSPPTPVQNNMTSNSAPSPNVASADGDVSNAYKAFDGSTATGWVPPSAGYNLIRDLGAGNEVILTGYAIQANSASFASGSYPTGWTIAGSNDNSAWTSIDTRTGQTFTTGERKQFVSGSPGSTPYRYLRFTASGIYGFCAVAEIAFNP